MPCPSSSLLPPVNPNVNGWNMYLPKDANFTLRGEDMPKITFVPVYSSFEAFNCNEGCRTVEITSKDESSGWADAWCFPKSVEKVQEFWHLNNTEKMHYFLGTLKEVGNKVMCKSDYLFRLHHYRWEPLSGASIKGTFKCTPCERQEGLIPSNVKKLVIKEELIDLGIPKGNISRINNFPTILHMAGKIFRRTFPNGLCGHAELLHLGNQAQVSAACLTSSGGVSSGHALTLEQKQVTCRPESSLTLSFDFRKVLMGEGDDASAQIKVTSIHCMDL